MKLIVGLGNPGAAYEATRHNLGYDAVLLLAHRLGLSRFRPARHGLVAPAEGSRLLRAARQAIAERSSTEGDGEGGRSAVRRSAVTPAPALLLLPTTYMNLSGIAVRWHLRGSAWAPEDIIVVHDDLDLPSGKIKVKVGGSSGGHRGVESILAQLGLDGFVRVKIGIGRPPEGADQVAFVTQRPTGDEASILERATGTAAEAALIAAVDGPATAMNLYNRREDAEAPASAGSNTQPDDGGALTS